MANRSQIVLYHFGDGSSASIEYDDGESFCVAQGRSMGAKTACKKAAKQLRTLADKFDMLADENEPYQLEVQKRVNRWIKEKVKI
jgi:hypothetical protein